MEIGKRKRMSATEWKTLTEKDKGVLNGLGLLQYIKPLAKSRTKPRAEPRALPKPYILLRTSTCRLCKTVTKYYFRMLPSEQDPFLLEAKRITPRSIHPSDLVAEDKEKSATCAYCSSVLEKETKGELIKRILYLESRRI